MDPDVYTRLLHRAMARQLTSLHTLPGGGHEWDAALLAATHTTELDDYTRILMVHVLHRAPGTYSLHAFPATDSNGMLLACM